MPSFIRTHSSPNLLVVHPSSSPSRAPVKPTFDHGPMASAGLHHLAHALENLPDKIDQAVGKAVARAMAVSQAPMHDALQIVYAVAKHAEAPRTRGQKIAEFLHTWTMPIFQILLGVGMVVLGVLGAEAAFILMGVAPIVTGLGTMVVLICGAMTPHPFDAVKSFFERRHAQDFEKPEMRSGFLADTTL